MRRCRTCTDRSEIKNTLLPDLPLTKGRSMMQCLCALRAMLRKVQLVVDESGEKKIMAT